jgi:hypothetical protein
MSCGVSQLPDTGADLAQPDVIAHLGAHHHHFVADLGGNQSPCLRITMAAPYSVSRPTLSGFANDE